MDAREIRQRFVTAPAPRLVAVPCPELDLTIWARGLSATERDDIEAESAALRAAANFEPGATYQNRTARIVVRGACAEDGTQVFTLEDVEAIGAHPALGAVLDRVYQVIERLSATTEKEIDALLGKSSPPPGASSSSGSASGSG